MEQLQEFVHCIAQSKMITEKARSDTIANEKQIKILQMRRNQLQTRLALLRVAHEAVDKSIPGDVPRITQELRLVTMESETIPAVFFTSIEHLEQQQSAHYKHNYKNGRV